MLWTMSVLFHFFHLSFKRTTQRTNYPVEDKSKGPYFAENALLMVFFSLMMKLWQDYFYVGWMQGEHASNPLFIPFAFHNGPFVPLLLCLGLISSLACQFSLACLGHVESIFSFSSCLADRNAPQQQAQNQNWRHDTRYNWTKLLCLSCSARWHAMVSRWTLREKKLLKNLSVIIRQTVASVWICTCGMTASSIFSVASYRYRCSEELILCWAS